MLGLSSCVDVPGCTDKDAFNYNAKATVDDGSCIEKIFGCTKTTAINYNSDANTDDGSCILRSEAMKNDRETKEQLVDNTSNFKGKEVEVNLLITSQTIGDWGFRKGDLRNYVKWANEEGVALIFKLQNGKEIYINVPNNIDIPGDGVNKPFLVKFICNEGSLTSGNTATRIQRKYY
jgi:hypothetical protein